MRAPRLGLGSILGSIFLLTVVACGAAPEPSSFRDRDDSEPGFEDKNGKGPIGKDGKSTPDEFKECATSSAAATPKPVYLVFLFDRSGSMKENGSIKWNSAKAASRAFFESPQSAGLSASLTFFPASGGSCKANLYTTPSVPMSGLPSATFGVTLDDEDPDGDTPTYVALKGALDYAETVAQGPGKDGKLVVVLVTDGLPASDCEGDSIGAVKNLAATKAATIPTYVIGVGNQLNNLKEIAIGGGTNDALIVQTTNPSQVQQDFAKAIETVKGSALSCEYKIPAPTNGEQLDRGKVNVVYTPAGAAAQTLKYDQACSTGTGWRYDDPNAPTQIVMCNASCDAIKTKPGKVDVLFGCATKGGVN